MEYKGQVLKLEDTNIAYLGSDLELKVKKAAAENEEQWKGVGQEPGILIWRIEKFQVVPWPKAEYGSFFSGDSYIILHTYKKQGKDNLYWNAHMWVGTFTTMDEAGTAAYKIVELDDVFDRQVVLFREAQGYESDIFLSYFNVINIMDGGIETGFKKVPIEEYRPRLLHVRKGKTDYRIAEVTLNLESLNSGDVFILDSGLIIYNWIGSKSNSYEKFKAASIVQALRGERNGKSKVISLEEGDNNDEFWALLGGKGEIKSASSVTDENVAVVDSKLFQLSDSSGELELKQVSFNKDSFTTDDVFIIDLGIELLIWIGLNATANEKRNSIGVAQQYLKDFGRPSHLPYSCMSEGRESFRYVETFA